MIPGRTNASCSVLFTYLIKSDYKMLIISQNRGGDVALIAKLGDPSYKLELCSSVPAAGLVSNYLKM